VRTSPRQDVAEILDFFTPIMVNAVVEFRVPEAFGDQVRQVAEVAAEVGVHGETLRRTLRALAGKGLFDDQGDGRFALSTLGRQLLPDHPDTIVHLARYRPWDLHACAEFGHSLRSGEPAFPWFFGLGYCEYYATHPEASAIFDAHMARRTSIQFSRALPLLGGLPAVGSIIDIGGGNGALLARILAAHPGLQGVVFDLPHVAQSAMATLTEGGVDSRASIVGGSFFEAVPEGHDVYLLSSILHDWDDDAAVAILSNCREAMTPAARLILFEGVLAGPNEPDAGKAYDLHMLVLLGGRERTRDAWSMLLARGGFRLDRVTPTPSLAWVHAIPA